MNQIRVCTKRINTRNFILQNIIRLYTNFGLGGGNGPFGPHWGTGTPVHFVHVYNNSVRIENVRITRYTCVPGTGTVELECERKKLSGTV